jgi:hypothetical protein
MYRRMPQKMIIPKSNTVSGSQNQDSFFQVCGLFPYNLLAEKSLGAILQFCIVYKLQKSDLQGI